MLGILLKLFIFCALVFTQTGCLIELPVEEDSGDTSADISDMDGTISTAEGDGDIDTDVDTDTDTDVDMDSNTDFSVDFDTNTDVFVDTNSINFDSDSNMDSDGGSILKLCKPTETKPCENAMGNCVAGVQTCLADGTGWGECSILSEVEDSCDPGDDADCDGIANEGCACTEGDKQGCGPSTPVGICKRGTVTCTDGVWSTECTGQVLPAERDCKSDDDNDCDGHADNSLDNECRCIPETSQQCDLYGKNGIGICNLGEQTCEYISGTSTSDWGECIGAVAPETEVCDSDELDEDCDGIANEGCSCNDGAKKNCGTDVGICEFGKVTCIGGEWSTTCEGGKTPDKRDCTSSDDNDCDSFADNILDDVCQCNEGQQRECVVSGASGICQSGIQACVMASDNSSSHWGICESTVSPSTELCNNDGLDEDCDGSVNEGCACTNGDDSRCNDSLSCTTDSCVDGVCTHVIGASYCLIDNQCVSNNAEELNNSCRYCNATQNNTGWTNRPLTASCDDDVFCNGDDYCNGLGQCAHSGNPCTRDDGCYSTTCSETQKACYASAGKECAEPDISRQCQNSNCGGQILQQTTTHTCSGRSYTCDVSTAGSWVPVETCGVGQVCNGATNPTCVADLECECDASGNWYDESTDLCWQNTNLSSSSMNWDAADNYCDSGAFGGIDGWRLPNINELVSIVRGCGDDGQATYSSSTLDSCEVTCTSSDVCGDISGNCAGCQFQLGLGPGDGGCYRVPALSGGCEYSYTWSSSSSSNAGYGWALGFHDAYVVKPTQSADYLVRCVKSQP